MRALACLVALLPLRIWAGLTDARPVDPTVAPAPLAAGQHHPRLAVFDGGFAATWADSRPSDDWPDVSAAIFSPAGALVVGPIAVAAGPGAHDYPTVACGPAQCLVAWAFQGRVFARGLGFDGRLLGNAPLLVSRQTAIFAQSVALAAEGLGFRLLWMEDGRLTQRWMAADGGLGPPATATTEYLFWPHLASGPAGTALSGVTPNDRVVSMVALADGGFTAPYTHDQPAYFDGVRVFAGQSGFLMAWANTNPGVRRVERIDAAGAPVAGGSAEVLPGQCFPPLAAAEQADGGWLVACGELGRIVASEVSDAGATAPVTLDRFDNHSMESCAMAGPAEAALLVCTHDFHGLPGKADFRALSGAGLEPERPKLVGANGQSQPSAVRTLGGFLVAWQDERLDAGTESRVAALDFSGAPIGPAHSFAAGPGAQHRVALAAGNSRVFAAWREVTPRRVGLSAAELSATGERLRPVAEHDFGSALDDRLGIVAVPDGAVIAWTTWAPGGYTPYTATFDGTALGQPVALGPVINDERDPALGVSGPMLALATVVQESNLIQVRFLDQKGQPTSIPTLSLPNPGGYPLHTAVAGDGERFLVVWADGKSPGYSIYAQRVSRFGVLQDPVALELFNPSDDDRGDRQSSGWPQVVFDGTDYIVAFSRYDRANGGEINTIRVPQVGPPSAPSLAFTAPEDQTEVALAAGSVGRVLFTYRTFDPVLQAPRVVARVATAVPEGYRCLDSTECLAGTCTGGICCADALQCSPAPADGGSGGGGGDGGGGGGGSDGLVPRTLRVACGCGSGSTSLALLAAALLGAHRGRRRRV